EALDQVIGSIRASIVSTTKRAVRRERLDSLGTVEDHSPGLLSYSPCGFTNAYGCHTIAAVPISRKVVSIGRVQSTEGASPPHVTTLAILLILLSAGIHATWNLYAKRLAGGSE